MNDIEPWLDGDAPPDVAESLRAARAEAPRRATVERCVAVVGAAGALGISTSLASAASYGAGTKLAGISVLAKWGLSGFVAGTVLVTGVEVAERAAAPPSPVPLRTPSAAAPNVPTPHVPPAASATMVAEPLPIPVPSATRPLPASSGAFPSSDDRLAAELTLLSDVRKSIDRRDASTALVLLDEHDRRHRTDAQLGPEARYLRLEALELAGRRNEARAAARRVLELDPRGPHAARAREILEKE